MNTGLTSPHIELFSLYRRILPKPVVRFRALAFHPGAHCSTRARSAVGAMA